MGVRRRSHSSSYSSMWRCSRERRCKGFQSSSNHRWAKFRCSINRCKRRWDRWVCKRKWGCSNSNRCNPSRSSNSNSSNSNSSSRSNKAWQCPDPAPRCQCGNPSAWLYNPQPSRTSSDRCQFSSVQCQYHPIHNCNSSNKTHINKKRCKECK